MRGGCFVINSTLKSRAEVSVIITHLTECLMDMEEDRKCQKQK